jgi:hypothetical protein
MKALARFLVVLLSSSGTLACSTAAPPLFVPASTNTPLPAEFVNRHWFLNPGIYQSNLQELVGHVLVTKKVNGTCSETTFNDLEVSRRGYVKAGVQLVPDNKAQVIYHSRIDSGFAVASSALTILSASMSKDQRAEVTITDAVVIAVPDMLLDSVALEQLGAKPLPVDLCSRLLVKGAVLTTIVSRQFAKLQAGAAITGTAFGGAYGETYADNDAFAQNTVIGLTLIPVEPQGMGLNLAEPNQSAAKPIPTHGFTIRPDSEL